MLDFQCPNCGDTVSPAFSSVKMVTCNSCGTTLFLSNEAAQLAGEQGVMHEVPMLFGLGDHIKLRSLMFSIVGHARFSYGRGTWDEFCALDEKGEPHWISVDEGDIILQEEIPTARWPRYEGYLKLGSSCTYDGTRFDVVEQAGAECVALRGSFDEPLTIGQTYKYWNLQGEDGRLLSMEEEGRQRDWYIGHWFDPFDVQVLT